MSADQKALHGLMVEFDAPEKLVAAARHAREAGYRNMDGYSPIPVEGLSEALGLSPTRIPLIVLLGGLTGGLTGYLMQYYAAVISYPINAGGRPPHSWASFIPVTFELTILFAALSAVGAMFLLNGLPRPNHPVFNVPQFDAASRDRFFLCIGSCDPRFDRDTTRRFLQELSGGTVYEVEP